MVPCKLHATWKDKICLQKLLKFSIKYFFRKCDQDSGNCGYVLKKSLKENFIFCAVATLMKKFFVILKKKMQLMDKILTILTNFDQNQGFLVL